MTRTIASPIEVMDVNGLTVVLTAGIEIRHEHQSFIIEDGNRVDFWVFEARVDPDNCMSGGWEVFTSDSEPLVRS